RIGRRTDIACDLVDVAEQERRERQATAGGPDRAFELEGELSRPVLIARHAQVVGAADVDAELDRVILNELCDVADHLPLLLVLVQRAVAAVHAEAGTESDPAAVGVLADEPAEKT